MKGLLSLKVKKVDQAIVAYRNAKNLRPDLSAYFGLVKSFIAGHRYKEALFSAKEAVKAMPHNARALTLLGEVHAQHSVTRGKARMLYERALILDPTCTDAVLSLSDLEVGQDHYSGALKLLKGHLSQSPSALVHIKLGTIMGLIARQVGHEQSTQYLGEALGHFQEALSMNPGSEEARQGVARTEKMMKGMDPDPEDGGDPITEEGGDLEDGDIDAEVDVGVNETEMEMDRW